MTALKQSQMVAKFSPQQKHAIIVLSLLVCLLVFLPGPWATAQESGREDAARVKVPRYPVGTAVQVHLRNKETITGQVEKYAGDGFWIKAEGQGPRKDQKIFSFEIKSINPKPGTGSQTERSVQPRFGIDFSVGGADASVRVYRPKSSEDSEDSH
jgi:hypothetical protein